MRRLVTSIILTMLLTSMLTSAFKIQEAEASGTIYIRADGSIDPPTAPIHREGFIYTFTGNANDPMVIQRNNILIDGAGYTLQGSGIGTAGIYLADRSNVTVMNLKITEFIDGISLKSSSNNLIYQNSITNNSRWGINVGREPPFGSQSFYNIISECNISDCEKGILLETYAEGSTISENIITNCLYGIWLWNTDNQVISNNRLEYNERGIQFYGSLRNIVSGNELLNNQYGMYLQRAGISPVPSSDNKIFHNNFVANTWHAYIQDPLMPNLWDDSYLSGGNWWSDYTGTDGNGDGIGDTPYVMDDWNSDNYPFIQPVGGFQWVWGDDDNDGILNYLDVPGFSVSASAAPGKILGFDWEYIYSHIDSGSDAQSMLNEFRDWGAIDIGSPEHVWSAVFDLDGIAESMTQLRNKVPYVIPQGFVDWINGLSCPDGNLRYLVILHSDLEISDVSVLLAELGKALSDPKSFESWFDLSAYIAGMFGFELFRLYGIDHVKTDLLLDTTGFSSMLTQIASLKDAAMVVHVLDKVVTILTAVAAGAACPAYLRVIVASLVVKFFAFVIDFMEWKWDISNLVLDQIQSVLIMADPPAEKVVLQLFDPVSQNLLLGYNSTSGQDVGAYPYGFYVSDNDSAMLIVARNSANYRLTVTRNVPGSPLPYVLNVWDCVKNQTVTVGGSLESEQALSTDLEVESDVLKMPYLLIEANFSSLSPPSNAQVWVNVLVTDDIGQPINDANVTVHVNNLKILADNIGGGAYQTGFNTTGMLGFYNVTIYVANPPTNYLSGISSYPLMVGTSDISVINSTVTKRVIGFGYSATANLTVQNNGDTAQPFAVAFYANNTLISRRVSSGLQSGASTAIQFVLNTTSLSKGNYTIRAYAEPVPGETNTGDNMVIGGVVAVTIPGDVNGDQQVDATDLNDLRTAYGSTYALPAWNANCDINGDNKVDVLDLFLQGKNYGKTDP